MSTILDALKKSEQERKLNKLPTLNDMQAPQEPTRWPLVVMLFCVVLAVLVSAGLFVWWQTAGSTQGEQGSQATQSSKAAQAAKFDASNSVDEPSGNSSQLAEPQLDESAVLVNVVSYSDNPEQRFAMVNGKMVREGDFVQAGLKVEKITMSHVELNFRGKRINRKP